MSELRPAPCAGSGIMTGDDMTIVEVARMARAAGLSVWPPKEDGSKSPIAEAISAGCPHPDCQAALANGKKTGWVHGQHAAADENSIERWYANGRTGLGVILGFGDVEALDFDDWDAYEAFMTAADEVGLGGVVGRMHGGFSETTPNDGVHIVYRCSEVSGNTKLARRLKRPEEMADANDKIKVLIETRGHHGYLVTAPSNGKVHPTGQPYKQMQGSFETIATISPEQRKDIWQLACTFDQMPRQEEPGGARRTTKPSPGGGEERPGDDFNRRADWSSDVLELHGWTALFIAADGNQHWRRPGKKNGTSATINENGAGVLYVFSSSTVFEQERAYTKFGAYAVLNHGGDFEAAARQLRSDGYGTRTENRTERHARGHDPDDPGPTEPPSDDDGHDPELERDASWEPIDLGPAWRGEKVRPAATVFRRDDGIALLLPGINYLHGDSGDGKSFVALIATVAELRAGVPVIWLTYEDANEDLIVDRLRLIGATDQDIKMLIFITPQEGLTHGAEYIADLAAERSVHLVVLDSVGEAMAVGGVNEDKDAEVGPWFRQTSRVIIDRAPAAAIWPIDHSTKAKDNPLFPSGSKRKRAAVTGRAYLLNVRSPLAVGEVGYLQLVVAKDRGGMFKRGAIAAEIRFDATTTPYAVTVTAPRTGDSYSPKVQRRNAHERVLEVLGEARVGLTAEHVARILNGPDRIRTGESVLQVGTVQNALTKLATGPEVSRHKGPPEPGRFTADLWQIAHREAAET